MIKMKSEVITHTTRLIDVSTILLQHNTQTKQSNITP